MMQALFHSPTHSRSLFFATHTHTHFEFRFIFKFMFACSFAWSQVFDSIENRRCHYAHHESSLFLLALYRSVCAYPDISDGCFHSNLTFSTSWQWILLYCYFWFASNILLCPGSDCERRRWFVCENEIGAVSFECGAMQSNRWSLKASFHIMGTASGMMFCVKVLENSFQCIALI